jgi:hypothetical protein
MVVVFGPCCLCGREIEETDTDPCRITVETFKGKWQAWSCHGTCFSDCFKSPKIVENPESIPGSFVRFLVA